MCGITEGFIPALEDMDAVNFFNAIKGYLLWKKNTEREPDSIFTLEADSLAQTVAMQENRPRFTIERLPNDAFQLNTPGDWIYWDGAPARIAEGVFVSSEKHTIVLHFDDKAAFGRFIEGNELQIAD